MTKYELLVRVLDSLCAEAPEEYKFYRPQKNDPDAVTAARCRAYIHLLLKSNFGLLTFAERDKLVTDGKDDGGVDAYYIDQEVKVVYFVQSKFRNNEANFLDKEISPEELLRMDLDRMLGGETDSAAGIEYNGKIQGMIRSIRSIPDIGRYRYKVIVLANLKGITREKVTFLTGGFPCEVINSEAAYNRLLFPMLSGTYFTPESLHISLSLGNKNSGPKISYTVNTEFGTCTITVVFVPVIEIAKAMHKFRNAILKYNPRSYLEHEGQTVNAAIRSSIEDRKTNEFALFNNGITILSDESYLNERIGQKDMAQLTMVNPQIINGGQTAYTLSVIFRDNINGSPEVVFGDKEVLVKIITFEKSPDFTDERRSALIEDISRATNQQTVVTNADRRSNDATLLLLQRRLFEKTGILLERKRGEFSDGIREGYLDRSEMVDRSLFFRVASAVLGDFSSALNKKLVQKCDFRRFLEVSDETYQRYALGVQILRTLAFPKGKPQQAIKAKLLSKVMLAVGHAMAKTANASLANSDASKIGAIAETEWENFLSFVQSKATSGRQFRINSRGERYFDIGVYLRQANVVADIMAFFKQGQTAEAHSASPSQRADEHGAAELGRDQEQCGTTGETVSVSTPL